MTGQPRGVAGHQIDFEIDFIARAPFAPGRDFKRVRNEQHRKTIAFHPIDRQRRAIERDGPFFRDETREFMRSPDVDAPHAIEIRDRDDFRHSVHMPGHDMAAKFVA